MRHWKAYAFSLLKMTSFGRFPLVVHTNLRFNTHALQKISIYINRDVNPCPCPCPKGLLKDFFKVLVLVLVLGGQVLVLILVLGGSGPGGPCPCPGPWGSGPCPYPGPCGLVLVFSPYKDLFPLFHYSDLFA